ncbi:hypothetical protein BESB_021250 [Besnoitia besnoiti]|uniref:Uncharacterized protein n=1 Tax=Besnoitia besnoiti TaxID=94643 RepID=A0A2A9M4N9_BESBE|nr:hypothetical protein BESB_021250 [Besnoitia besnoiti]PFH32184.1 hypothetical protein BESB_021250 [Besnoitia besnoiti]
MESQPPANQALPEPLSGQLQLQLLQRHRELLVAQQLQQTGKQSKPTPQSPQQAAPQPCGEKDKKPVVTPTLPLTMPMALLQPPLQPLTPEQQLQRQQLLQHHLRQRQLQQLLQQASLRSQAASPQDPASRPPQPRAVESLQTEVERQRQQVIPPLQAPSRLVQLQQLQQRLLLQAAAQRQQPQPTMAPAGKAPPLRPPPAVVAAAAAAAAAAVRRGALQLLMMPRQAGILGADSQKVPTSGAPAPDAGAAGLHVSGGLGQKAENAVALNGSGSAAAGATPASEGVPPRVAVPAALGAVAALASSPLCHGVVLSGSVAANSGGSSRPPTDRQPAIGASARQDSDAQPSAAANGGCRAASTEDFANGTNRKASAGGAANAGPSKLKDSDADLSAGLADGGAKQTEPPVAAPGAASGREGNSAVTLGAGGDREDKKGDAPTPPRSSESSVKKHPGSRDTEEEEDGEASGSLEDDVFRYEEDVDAPDALKRRHTLDMPVGWGVRKPVAEATGNGGTFKKIVWVNEIVGGIRRQVYWLERTKEWCVQFFRPSGSDTRVVTKKFLEDGANKFRAVAAAYNLMPWDCSGSDYRRPQGRPLKRRVFTAADFEEGTAWCHYPASLSLHPYPSASGTPYVSAAAAPPSVRSRRRAEAPLLHPRDLDAEASQAGLLSSCSSACVSLQNSPCFAPHDDVSLGRVATRSASSANSGRLTSGLAPASCSSTPLMAAHDLPLRRGSRHNGVSSSAPVTRLMPPSLSPRLSPRLLDTVASVAAATFRPHAGLRKRKRAEDEAIQEEASDSGSAQGDRWYEQDGPADAASHAPRQESARISDVPGEALGDLFLGARYSEGEDDDETSLLRQLILDQADEDPPECIASWSKALLPWPPCASTFSSALIPCSESPRSPSPSSSLLASSLSPLSPRRCNDVKAFPMKSTENDGSCCEIPHTTPRDRAPDALHSTGKSGFGLTSPVDANASDSSRRHMALPPGPSSSLSRLFCHLCCAPERREALGKRAFAKVVEVIFPNAFDQCPLRPARASRHQKRACQTPDVEVNMDVCQRLAKREQTLENYVLISRVLRALAKKESDEFFRNLKHMFQAHAKDCAGDPADFSKNQTGIPWQRSGANNAAHSVPEPDEGSLSAEGAGQSSKDLSALADELQAKPEEVRTGEPRNVLDQAAVSTSESVISEKLGDVSSFLRGAASPALETSASKGRPACKRHAVADTSKNEGKVAPSEQTCEALQAANRLGSDDGGAAVGGQGAAGKGGAVAANETSGGCKENRANEGCRCVRGVRPRGNREPTVTEVLRVLGWILAIDEDQEGVR